MSFKREGDDLSLLNKLKHKRVSELFQTHIPEDEAKLLSNGRLCCLICSFRPIFDTMAVLAQHRKGKKHILELSRYIKKQQDMELEMTKRQQILSLKNEAIDEHLGLGVECSVSYPDKRKVILEMPKAYLHEQPSLPIRSGEKSTACQLKKYLKGLHRKPSLRKKLDESKANYLAKGDSQSEHKEVIHKKEKSKEKGENKITNESLKIAKMELSRNMSGWLKNSDGTWSKDPNAEFDTDDEEPN